MDTQSPKSQPSEANISGSGKLLICFFVLVFFGFGVMLFGDLMSAFWR